MRARILPVAEWDRLPNESLREMLATMNPADVSALVIEELGEIVACWGVMRMTHLEGLWIDPAHKTAAIRLLRLAGDVAESYGSPWVVTGAATPEVKDMILRLGGQQVPIETYVLSLKRERRVA